MDSALLAIMFSIFYFHLCLPVDVKFSFILSTLENGKKLNGKILKEGHMSKSSTMEEDTTKKARLSDIKESSIEQLV